MKIRLLVVGKTTDKALKMLEENYTQRLTHYISLERVELPDIKYAKTLTTEQLKEKEGALLLSKLETDDYLMLLDDKGRQMTSMDFANWLEVKYQAPFKRINFCVGGAFGFSKNVYERANDQLSLSKMTFSHQMVRTVFLEQLYRACTLIKGEKYHHE